MIIICEKCNKKFNIKDNLIPTNGRLLKCGNCEYEWFFKINENTKPDLEYKTEETINTKKNDKVVTKTVHIEPEIKIPKNNENIKETIDKQDKLIQKNDSSANILRNTFVFIISFIAFIIVFDTFKMYLSKFIPNIISILDNLYLSLLDLKLFIKDLFN